MARTDDSRLELALGGLGTLGVAAILAAILLPVSQWLVGERFPSLAGVPSYVPIALGTSGVLIFVLVGLALTRIEPSPPESGSSGPTQHEAAAASERSVASTADTLTRDFQARIGKEIDAAVSRLASTSDQVITSQLASRIDATVGANLVSVLGEQLAKQTGTQHKLNEFRLAALDSFIQMRSRAIQYADSAQRQSAFFRWTAIALSMGGLATLAFLLYENYKQFLSDPELIKSHAEWTMIILRNGPAYTFVLLCESLALVMFRYQSKSLEYMRYFSNEGTNLDARRIAFMSALFYEDKAAMKKLIEKLESTERNFLIDKNQRTLELANNESEDRVVERLFRKVSLTTSLEREPAEERTGSKKASKKTASAHQG